MNIVKKLSFFVLAFLLVGSAAFGATTTLSPTNVPKGAYVNGSDGDQQFFQTISIVLEADGVDGWAADDDIVINFPDDIELADFDEDGTYTDEVAVTYKHGNTGGITLTVNAAGKSSITIDLAAGNNVMAGDKINVFFPIKTAETPGASTADYTVRFYDDSDGDYAGLESDGDATVTATFVDNLTEVSFTSDYAGGNQTSEKGKVYPTAARPVTSALSDYVEDFTGPDAGTEFLNNTGDFSGNWDVTGDFAADATDASYVDAAHAGTLTQTEANMATAPVGGVRYRFYFDATVNTQLVGGNLEIANTFATTDIDLITTADVADSYSRYKYFTTQADPGDFVIQNDAATSAGDVDLDNFELIRVGDEVLNNRLDFADNWTATDGVSIAGNDVNYTDNANGGTLTQSTFATAPEGGETYVFTYEVTDITDDYVGTATITTSFAASAQTLDLATTGAKEITFTTTASPGDFVLEFQNDDTDDADDITIDNFALYKLTTNGTPITSNLLTGTKLDNTSDTDDMQYYLWASQTSGLTRVDEQFGHRPIAAVTSDSNTVDQQVGFVNETATFAGTQLDGRLLEEGTWYFYVTSDLTGDWVLGSSDSLNVRHWPVFDTAPAGGIVDFDGDMLFESGVGNDDDVSVMYLESGGGVSTNGDWDEEDNAKSVNFHWNVEDVDDNASVKIYLNPTSASYTTKAALLADSTTRQISPDTLYEEGPSSHYWTYLIFTDEDNYEPAGQYSVYIVADDGKNSNVYRIEDSGSDDLELYVKHYPNLTFQDITYLHDEDQTTPTEIDFNTANQQYITFNWGETTDGDKDADGDMEIALYMSQLVQDDGGGDPQPSGFSSNVADVDATALSDDATNNPTQTVHVATILDTADGRKDNRYMFDVRNSGLEAGTYYMYGVITEGDDAQVIQMNSGTADDRPINLTHGEYVLALNPPEGKYLELDQTDRFQFKWSAFDKDATSSNFVNAYFMVKDGYEQMIDDLIGNYDIGELDDGAINFLSNGTFTSNDKWTDADGGFVLTGGTASFDHDNAATGTLTQTSADMRMPLEGSTQYTIEYDVSGYGDDGTAVTAVIPNTVATVELDLDVEGETGNTNVTKTFTTVASPTDFVISSSDADNTADEFVLDNIRIYESGVAHWLTGSSDGDDLPAAGVEMSNGKVTVDFSDITEDFDGNATTLSGDYHVYMIWADDGNLNDDDAETIVKAPGMINFSDFAPAATNFQLTPNRVTAELGDTLTLEVFASENSSEDAMIISVYLDVPTSRFTVIDQNDNAAGIQPWIDESSNFDGAQFPDTVKVNGDYYEIGNVEYDDDGTATDLTASGVKIGSIQLVVNDNYDGDALEKQEITFHTSGDRETGITSGSNNKLMTSVPDVAATIELATPGKISGHVEMEARGAEGQVVNIFVTPEGSMDAITASDYLEANGLTSATDTLQYTLGAGGNYEILRVPSGTYDVIVEKQGFLSQRIESQVVQPLSTTNVDFEGSDRLLAGDCGGYTTQDNNTLPDNNIDEDDSSILNSAFNSTPSDAAWNAYADFNADSLISVIDLNWYAKNYGVSGSSGEGLLYKKSEYRGTNDGSFISLVKNEDGSYTVKASNLNHLRAYSVELAIDPEAYDIEYFNDGLSKYMKTTEIVKLEDNRLFLVSAVIGEKALAQSELDLCNLEVTKLSDDASDLTISEVKLVDANNSESKPTIKSNRLVQVPEEFVLEDNYPNPFNPITNIKFALPEAGKVKLVVYDLLGNRINTLVSTNMQAGYYNAVWKAENAAGLKVSSGVYFYRLMVNNKVVDTKKMVLMK